MKNSVFGGNLGVRYPTQKRKSSKKAEIMPFLGDFWDKYFFKLRALALYLISMYFINNTLSGNLPEL